MNMQQIPRRATKTMSVIGAVAAIAGIALALVGIGLDWSGVWGGAGIGTGVGVALAGTYFCGLSTGLRQGHKKMWRPSAGGSQ